MAVISYFSKEKIEEAGLTMVELEAIGADFEKKADSYAQTAEGITRILLKTPGVHSVRYRIKDAEHLMEKVVRKRLENKDRIITIDTYEQEITDLAGVRVLHLFKSDWRRVHKFILATWQLGEDPTAYYRQGDSEAILEMFTKQNCAVKQHPAGYRSVHYIVETSPTKTKHYVEIQVRTIFEEGWSEVDHKVRYPSFSDDPLTNNLLFILNRLAGSADEMSSFVQDLHAHLRKSKRDFERLEREKDDQIKKLQNVIDHANISAQEKSTLEGVAKKLSEDMSTTVQLTGMRRNHWLRHFAQLQLGHSADVTLGTGSMIADAFKNVIDTNPELFSSPNDTLAPKSDPDIN